MMSVQIFITVCAVRTKQTGLKACVYAGKTETPERQFCVFYPTVLLSSQMLKQPENQLFEPGMMVAFEEYRSNIIN